MLGLPSLLSGIPDEFKPVAALGIGALILVCLVLLHGAGLHRILLQHKRGERRLRVGRPHLAAASMLFGWAVFLMLALHIAEIMIWAFVLIRLGLIARVHDAIYFCANAYTTLGFGQIALEQPWRNITPIIAISGLFTFAWTTSSLVDVVAGHSRLLEQLEDERERELELRTTLRADEGNARTNEREAERTERLEGKKQSEGASFLERYRVRKEVNKKVGELRQAEKKEIDELRTKEHEDEENLGQGAPPKA